LYNVHYCATLLSKKVCSKYNCWNLGFKNCHYYSSNRHDAKSYVSFFCEPFFSPNNNGLESKVTRE